MEKFKQIKELVLNSEPDFEKFYEKENKAAGTRCRKVLQDLKVLAQELRLEIQSKKNEGDVKAKAPAKGKAAPKKK